MRAVTIVLLALIAFISATPLKGCRQVLRQYRPEDDDPLRVKRIFFQDKHGKLYIEDLTESHVEIRAKLEQVTIYLYTLNNQNNAVTLKIEDLDDLINSSIYNHNKLNYFIIHGWKNDISSDMNQMLKEAILQKADVNVFVVDWGEIANYNYVMARSAVPDIGLFVGNYINLMIEHYRLPTNSFRMIGHSLGAHVAGLAGDTILTTYGPIDFIVGLDPAGPLYTVGNTENRLHAGNAQHVQVIHTSGTLLGWESDLGHSDFYPNGGRGQPGCGLDPVGTCGHSRSYILYEESILTGGFASTECDSYNNYTQGDCNDRHRSQFGGLDVDKTACGKYYFDTNRNSPYSKS